MSITPSSLIENRSCRPVIVFKCGSDQPVAGGSAMLHFPDLTRSVHVANGHSWIAGENNDKTNEGDTFTRDKVAFQNSLAALPLVTYQAGETVIASGSKTGRLLILRKGTVAILKESMEIARVAEPGAIFGELSLLLDRPHTADVCAVETSQLHVANASALLSQYPIAFRYVATVLANRLDAANRTLL